MEAAAGAAAVGQQSVSAQVVGNAFVQQYYHILHHSPELVFRFYQDISKLGRPEDDGSMSITTTMQAINDKILSLNYGDFRVEIRSVDSQESFNGGVLVLVTGYLNGEDNLIRNFSQTFFLAPQDRGYFVLNDMFRYVEFVNEHDATQVPATDVVAPEQDLPPVQQIHISDQHTPSVEEANEGEVYSPHENGDVPVEEEVPVAEVVDEMQDDSQMVVESNTKIEDAPKKSYASIVGNAFVQQYYQILHHSPELVFRFYQDISMLERPEDDGSMSITTTMQAINDKILSLNYGDFKVEIKSVDSQEYFNGGVLVLVTGYLNGEDNLIQNFSQTFLLAPKDRGYFVLNDRFRYVEFVNEHDATQVPATDVVAPEQDLPPVQQIHISDQRTPSVEEANEGEVYSPHENGDVPVEEEVPVAEVVDEMQDDSQMKTLLGVSIVLTLLVTLKLIIHEHNQFFVLAEFAHFVGILLLIYKLTTHKSCSGLSLKTQQLTATFLSVRLFCSLQLEGDIHTILDLVTLVATFWLIYMMKYKLKSSYMADLDNMKNYTVIVPCLVMAFFIHPWTRNAIISILWAFAVYIEGVSVLPQLRLMQNVKIIEPFTAHYVFALGVSRFFSCAHWIIKIYDTSGSYLSLMGGGFLWIPMIILAEIVQTFVLADFCYYYVKRFCSVMQGQMMVRLPA